MSDGYLSKDRQHLARQQRERRARLVRIDYTPNAAALAAINAKRGPWYPLNNNSGVLNAIVTEWAALAGMNKREVETPMTPAPHTGIVRPLRAPAREFGGDWPKWADSWLAAGKARAASGRVICGARRHRDGQPCQARSQPGKRRCKWHGGCSTGPRTADGKARALANLKQNRR
ncbi:MAG: HGGxSTG domain-containing protein [Luteimonas sp.]